IIEKAVRFYLAKISQQSLTEKQVTTQLSLLTMSDEIEAVGDIISKDIISLARKKRKKIARFSDEGWKELEQLHRLISENFDLLLSMTIQPCEEIMKKIERHEQYLNEMEQDLRQSHLMRLHEMLPETYETSTIHLDLLGQLRLINIRLAKIADVAIELK
ncbi:MAG: Na/Pi cotransporter family protein, partial [Deltaproteobacteria bacterium]|nr:Na/Pi cotransporter family protein [Deltaproteobacteria bacterium]